jgi:N-acetylmuramoyl-L-alanine amidase
MVLALLAAGLTEATLAVGDRGRTSDDSVVQTPLRPTVSAKPVVAPVVGATPTFTPVPTTGPTPSGPAATTNSFVHMRAAASTSSAILYNLNGGTVVQLLSWSDPLWQEVQYNGTTGYVYKTYLAY